MSQTLVTKSGNNLKAPLLFITIVYACWFTWQGPSSAIANFIEQISVAFTMLFGSIVAGGTALGGGAVAFPVMTKILDVEPATAKVFSLAIQSFGMTAASITIIFTGIKYYKNIALLALCGAIPGVLISLAFVADLAPRLVTKSIFSIFLIIFAITLLKSHRYQHSLQRTAELVKRNQLIIIMVGFCGGIVSGLIGSGADIAIFALLMLFLKRDLKPATATSVVIMAVVSIVGTLFNLLFLNAFTTTIQSYVLAAMPVVVIGAPLGAYLCAKAKEKHLLSALICLIALEVSFTCYELVLN